MRILEQELGVSPLEETSLLYQQILSGKLAAKIPVEPHNLTSNPTPAHPGKNQLAPLVGRERELALLAQVLEKAETGVTFIAIEGEAGVGKTRLAEEFLARAQQAGRVIAQARCYDGQAGLAYTPFLEGLGPLLTQESEGPRLASLPPVVLAEAIRLFPGLPIHPKGAAPETANSGPGAQARFFEALRQLTGCLLGGETPGLFFLDDLQWSDSGTLDLLAFLARRLKSTGCIILVAWRSEHSPNGELLTRLVTELSHAGMAIHLPLARMNPDEIARLAASRGTDLPAGLAERLYQESEGLPFIALEYLNAIGQANPGWELPGGVRTLLHHRLQAPGEAARQLLAAAAVIGRSFDFSTLQGISGRSEWETVSGLEELVNSGLIRELGGSEYDFSHDKLRTVVYEETSTARRRLLHLRAGEATASGGHGGREAHTWAGLAANHFLQAGQSVRAAELFQQAGDQARLLHANGDALAAYQAALAAGHPDPAGLHEACGDLFTLRGEYSAAISSYQTAAAFCSPDCLSNLMHKLGEVYHRRGEWEAAEGHYRTALEAAGEDSDPNWQSHLFADWSLTVYHAAQTGKAQELAEKALAMAQNNADPTALSQSFNMLGILARARGELDRAGAFFERSLNAASGPEHLALNCAALHNLARLEEERGRPAEAIPLVRRALEYCTVLGDRHHLAALLNTLADLHHDAGNDAEAMVHLKQAVALFAEIGEDAGQDQSEIWKLTEW